MTRHWSGQVGVLTGLAISALFWADGAVAQRQPVADQTLGEERSIVTSIEFEGIPGDLITEGARRGPNLFHSFQEFNIDQGRAAYFANPVGVENIFGRVTGGGRSEILGQVGVFGEANLFLLNPNGIVFGPNSSLFINGSFLATTADAIRFGEQGWFSATTPEAPSPLLTINPSAFFFNQMPASPITVRSTIPIDPDLETIGLSVGVGENLALLGGNINVEGGGLNASGGRIDLGAVKSAGTIGLNAEGSFVFPPDVQRGDIVFTEDTRADVRTIESGGAIMITAQRITITGGSRLQAGILPEQGLQGSQAGDIRLDAAEQILMTQSSRIQNVVSVNSQGNAGNIEIATPILELMDGARLDARTRGQGDAGRVIITASDRATFQGASKNGVISAVFSTVEESGNGNGGDIKITTRVLEVMDGAALVASTRGQGNAGRIILTASDRIIFNNGDAFSSVGTGGDGDGSDINITTPFLEVLGGAQLIASTRGQGNAGRVIISVSDRVLLDGVNSSGFSSGFFISTLSNATGSGRDVIVRTPDLQISHGAVIDAGTANNQRGGNILIDAAQVSAISGGQVITTTAGAGQAGDITINADRIHLSGRDLTFPQRVRAFGRDRAANQGNGESGLFANTRLDSMGNGGSINLRPIDLTVRNHAQISAQSQGSGAAGDVMIQAQSAIVLDNYASINSDTNGGQGDIDLAARLLVLQENSTITTNASGLATGGNIDIEADFIVAAPNENSDIFANAFEGSGGEINLTALAIFGLEFRTRAELQQLLGDNPADLTPRNLPSNDVTAFSQTSPNIDVGTVTFRTPDVDPSQGLVELPIAPLIAADRIVSTCPTDGGGTAASLQDEFTVTGRGGLPVNPLTPFNGDTVLAGWATLDDQPNNTPISPPNPTMPTPAERAIVEATGWSRDAAGNVVLIAAAPAITSQSPLSNSVHCH